MNRCLYAALALLLAPVSEHMPAYAADNAALETSPSEQPIADFAEEWRRARKLMGQCGWSSDQKEALGFAEGLMLYLKARDARAHGQAVASDELSYALGHKDSFAVTGDNCVAVGNQLKPILDAITALKVCDERKKAGDTALVCKPAIYRAPRFK